MCGVCECDGCLMYRLCVCGVHIVIQTSLDGEKNWLRVRGGSGVDELVWGGWQSSNKMKSTTISEPIRITNPNWTNSVFTWILRT